MNTKIAVVDDDPDIRTLIKTVLHNYGFDVSVHTTAREFKQAINEHEPHICIIDLGLPDIDGFQLVRDIMDKTQCGIIIISGRGALPDKVLGLELGADDYLCKPFDPRELVARINSVLRRIAKNSDNLPTEPSLSTSQATFEQWVFDNQTLTISNHSGHSEQLSAAEGEILNRFLQSPKRILSRDQLRYETDETFDRSIDVRISRLRRKLESDPKNPTIIKTVYGAGYILTSEVVWR